MPLPLLPPAAFMGFRPDYKTGALFVRVCAWCPDKKEAEREARRLDCDISHGICPACYQSQTGRQLGEK